MHTKIYITATLAQQHHISNLDNSQFTNIIWHHVVLSLIVDWWDAMVEDWCSAVHDTSGATAPLSHICNW